HVEHQPIAPQHRRRPAREEPRVHAVFRGPLADVPFRERGSVREVTVHGRSLPPPGRGDHRSYFCSVAPPACSTGLSRSDSSCLRFLSSVAITSFKVFFCSSLATCSR